MSEDILVCLSTSPASRNVIDAAAHMAKASGAAFHAVFVETSAFRKDPSAARSIASVRSYAEARGAVNETLYGDNIPRVIAEYVRLSGITAVFIGDSPSRMRSIARAVSTHCPDTDVYVIPNDLYTGAYQMRWMLRESRGFSCRDTLISLGILTAATVIGILFGAARMSDSNIIPLYILAVLAISVLTSSSLYGAVSSAASVFIFNWFFTEPKYTLRVIDPQYMITFAVMFISAVLTSSLAGRLKAYARKSAQNSYRTRILLDTSQLLQQVSGMEAIAGAAAGQIAKLLDCAVIVSLKKENEDTLSAPSLYGTNIMRPEWTSETDREAMRWAYLNRRQAGAGTEVYPSASLFYLAIRIRDTAYGVFGIETSRSDLDPFLLSLLLSILGECALAMENEKNLREKEDEAENARSQKLRADLLRSISHDLRTPLTSISGNATLLQTGNLSEADKQRIYGDIYTDAMWLYEVVENLLSVTRLEKGAVLNKQAELMDEVIEEAVRHVDKGIQKHPFTCDTGSEILLADMDARLIVQVIVNLLNNAVKYTPDGTPIILTADKENGYIRVSVKDLGPGIPDPQKQKVFEMFYTGSNHIADARRSMGLGLALCESIIRAHNGTITLTDNTPHGAVFTFRIPAKEVNYEPELSDPRG